MCFEPNSPLHNVGPRGPIGSIINVVICGGLAVATLIFAIIQGNPAFLLVTAIFIVMEIQFVRVAIRANKRYRTARKASNAERVETAGE